MRIVEINERYYTVPETWNELTGKQLIRVMEVLYGNYATDTALLNLLKILTGMSWYRFFRTGMKHKAPFLDLATFLINTNSLTDQLLPVYKRFHGPAKDFDNITGEEFVFSEDLYFKCFTQAGPDEPRQMHEEYLNELVAILYRRQKPGYKLKVNKDGDPREAFNQYVSAFYAMTYICKWPLAAKLAIFTWYETCRQQMIDSNPDVFDGGSGEPAKYGLVSVMRVIAEGGIHGTFENVQKMYVKMWMVELNEKAEEAKRNEKATQ